MGNAAVFASDSSEVPAGNLPDQAPVVITDNPEITIYADNAISEETPTAVVTATFSGISESITADLTWYLDGVAFEQKPQQLLVEGTSVEATVELDVTDYSATTAMVRLEMTYDGQTVTGETGVPVALPAGDTIGAVRTAEIPVEILRETDLFEDETLEETSGSVSADDACLLLSYESDDGDLEAIEVQLPDGSSGWVSAKDAKISEENVTTDMDYDEKTKTTFVNDYGFTSETDYLVWVNLYTQKVNVFTAEDGGWVYIGCYSCASGKNTSPTTIGVFKYESRSDRWDLPNDTYVEPVLVFNGGEAFTSRPFDADTDEIADETMGEPASGGSVRMEEDSLAQLDAILPIGSTVVIY